MTIKTLWITIVKILGIWLILEGFSVIGNLITTISYLTIYSNNNSGELLLLLGAFVLSTGFYAFLLWLFVFKSSWVVHKLKLDQYYEETKLDLSIPLKTTLIIATIITGGFIFVDSLPLLCKQLFSLIQQSALQEKSPDYAWIIFLLVKTLTGYLLVIYSRSIVAYIKKHSE